MAIIAPVEDGKLKYNYTDSSKEKSEATGSELGYDQFLQLLCAEMQYQDPLEPTSNTDYVAQLATFSQVEATLTMADTQMNSMANALVGKQVIIKHTQDDGSVKYVDGKVDYVLYENGETMLSVSNGLYPLSELDTVADSDYYEAVGLAKTFASMVAMLPDEDNIQTIYQGAVQEVRDVYDSMTSYQKGFVDEDVLAVFEKIEARLNEMLKAEEGASDGQDTEESEGSDAEGETEGA